MKYAAKRTWPERPKAWEYQDDAETAEAFGRAFAAARQLEVGTEFVVIEREGEDADLQFFRVTERSPYVLEPAEPRAGGGASETPAAVGERADSGDAPLPPGLDLRPFASALIYMGKVGLIAVLAIVAMTFVIRSIQS